ncbi:hypothetical protein Agabi119p4_11554 [Agaricus bisporus var. burnettii]|uniref:RNA-directed DNA polymerase n=1 Tax=Agaricus bisporus var. burnettii TaxID=192524 RepID=A0A8H7C1G2_AGABI|nr:hypothetical protein Agabi119p4_11554 [Agaricus bisporus var. burnettii]
MDNEPDSEGFARVNSYSNSNTLPTITRGILTPTILDDWQVLCQRIFSNRQVPAGDQVRRVLRSFNDLRLRNYVSEHYTYLETITFDEFMVLIRDEFLPLGWDDDILSKILQLQGPRPFDQWVATLRNNNGLLKDTGKSLSDSRMREQIKMAMNDDIKKRYRERKDILGLESIPTLERWIARITVLAEEVESAEKDQMKKITDATVVALAKYLQDNQLLPSVPQKPSLAFRLSDPRPSLESRISDPRPSLESRISSGPRPPLASRISNPLAPRPQVTTAAPLVQRFAPANPPRVPPFNRPRTYTRTPVPSNYPRPPPLNEDTRKVCFDHSACFKCRQPYADHIADNCALDNLHHRYWEHNYTKEELEKLRREFLERQGLPYIPETSAAILGEEYEESSGVLEDDIGGGAEEYVSTSLPSHLWWTCRVDSAVRSTTPVKALIDHGSPTVLISYDLATRLSLRQTTLHRRILMESPLGDEQGKSCGRSEITQETSLKIFSCDGQWTAQPVRALIVPHLHLDLILGLNFLTTNKIVVDAETRSVFAKDSGYQLLQPHLLDGKGVRQRRKGNLQKLLYREREQKEKKERQWEPVFREITRNIRQTSPVATRHFSFALLQQKITDLSHQKSIRDKYAQADAALKEEFKDRFPTDLPHVDSLPEDVYHRILLTATEKMCISRTYSCPRKYRDAWRILIEGHLKAGRIRPSSSPFSSPSFLIPKADRQALPRWVNDYRRLNDITVTDRYPLPRIDDILADCARGKIWGKIDMTNAFFQTRMHPDDIQYTATRTPFGLYEWTVMPMGLKNSPATHQRRVTTALRHLIGKICHVYLDDIIIWSSTFEEHVENCRRVLETLRKAQLLCSATKTSLFHDEIYFLGHKISARGVEADPTKIEKILDWPRPRSASEVRRFLGLCKFVSQYIPRFSEIASPLYPLTSKRFNNQFPPWTEEHEKTFQTIKNLMVNRKCLVTIDHDNMEDNQIFVTCDASSVGTGAVLSFGKSWETARPVAFESRPLVGAELNYPTHEQELLAIIRSLKKWRMDLLGNHFTVFTDHKTLLNFNNQKDLSRRQARWMEFLSQYDYNIQYLPGHVNTAADALSRMLEQKQERIDRQLPPAIVVASILAASIEITPQSPSKDPALCAAVFQVESDEEFLDLVKEGYTTDEFVMKLRRHMNTEGEAAKFGIEEKDGLYFVKGRLVIPKVAKIRERLFQLAHDLLGHFGGKKSYAALQASFYWPRMQKELENGYVPSCAECQRNKARTSRNPGPLHLLPIPDARFSAIAIDFVGPMPEEENYNYLATITDRLGADIKLIPCRTDMTAPEFAHLFFDHWFCDNGAPSEIITDRDRLFVSTFWAELMKLIGIEHKMSTAYHPQTDGASERTNKTVLQALRFFVDRNQKGWVKALPRVRFYLMNSVNSSTGLSGFQLKSGHSPRLIPPLAPLPRKAPKETKDAQQLIKEIQTNEQEAKDNLLAAKIYQAHYANAHRAPEPVIKEGDRVLLDTANLRREHLGKGQGRVAKLMPRWDGPYSVIKAHPDSSSYTLNLTGISNIHPTFHVSRLKPFRENDNTVFPSRGFAEPGPICTDEGTWEHTVEKVIDERARGRGKQYLVRWVGFGPEHDEWIAGSRLMNNEALDHWEKTGVNVLKDSKHKRRAETPASEAVGLLEQEAEYNADISDSDNDGPETAERWSNAHAAGISTSAVRDGGWLKFGRGKNVEEQISMTRKEGGAEHDGTSIRRQENNEEDENALVINHGYDADDEADGVFE